MRTIVVALITIQILSAEKPRGAQDLLEAAEQFVAQKKFPEAIKLYTKAIASEPKSASLLARRGLLHRQAGSPKNAQLDCSTAVKMDSNLDIGHRCLALLFEDQGNLEQAMQSAATAIRLRAEDPENIRIGEELTRKLGTHLQAETVSTPPPRAAAIEADPNARSTTVPSAAAPVTEINDGAAVLGQELRVRAEAGNKHLQNREFDQAIALASEVLAKKTDHREALTLRCAALVESGAFEKAVGDCSSALKAIPNSPEISYYRGWARVELKQYESGIEDLNITLMQRPDHAEAYFLRGAAYHAMDDLTMALSDYTHAVLRNPKLKSAWKARGEIKIALGDPAGGKADLDRAATI